jgi:O-antigen/teichoic acid export membrane protein
MPGSSQHLSDIRGRALKGLIALALRGGAAKLISVASLILLSRLLAPEIFGAFAIILLPIGILSLLVDMGVSAALIQRGEHVLPEEEGTAFSIRLFLAILLGGALIIGSYWLVSLYDLPPAGKRVIPLMSITPFIDAFGTVPSTRLNRELRFDRLALAEVGGLVVGQSTALIMAWQGLGLWSLAWGGIATSVGGTLLVNLSSPWTPQPVFNVEAARRLLSFGWKYQSQGLLHLAVDQIVPALGGFWLSGSQIGHITWSQDVARWARIPADYAARVGFPAFSLLRADRRGFVRLLRQTVILFVGICTLIASVGLLTARLLIEPIFGPEWLPALPVLIVYLFRTPFDALSTILLPVIYAQGEAQTGLRLSLTWALLMWGLGVTLLLRRGDVLALPLAFLITTGVMSVIILLTAIRLLRENNR